MTHNCKHIVKSEGCCRRDKNMIKCAAAAIDQMKTMFDSALCPIKENPEKRKGRNVGCVMDPVCNINECPFRGTLVAPNVLQTYCTKTKEKTGGGRSDRDAMRLMPGDVGLRGDRATFSLGRDDGLSHGGYNLGGGAVYYNVRPNGIHGVMSQTEQDDDDQRPQTQDQDLEPDQEQDEDRDQDPDQDQEQDKDRQAEESGDQSGQKDRKHVMEMLPTTAKPTLGPVTGLPVKDDEHVFVLWLGKRPGEPDEKARLQIEVRVPKWMPEREPEPVTPEPVIAEEPPEVTVKPKGKKHDGSKKHGSSKGRDKK